jgi:hypothetical protein
MADSVKLVILGRNERISDLPEYKRLTDKSGIDVLARSHDYTRSMKLIIVPEENVVGNPADPRIGDNGVIRGFARALYHVTGTRPIDPGFNPSQQYELRVQRLDIRFDQKLDSLHKAALAAGKWKNTGAMLDRVEYWARGVLAYFDASGQHSPPLDAGYQIATRETLKSYDPGLFELVETTMYHKGKVDWRLRPR